MLKFYELGIDKMGVTTIEAKGTLPIKVGPLNAAGKVIMTMEGTADNATVVKITNQNGTSTLIASPLEETTLLF